MPIEDVHAIFPRRGSAASFRLTGHPAHGPARPTPLTAEDVAGAAGLNGRPLQRRRGRHPTVSMDAGIVKSVPLSCCRLQPERVKISQGQLSESTSGNTPQLLLPTRPGTPTTKYCKSAL